MTSLDTGKNLWLLARPYGSTTPVNRKLVHRVAQNYTSRVKNSKREVEVGRDRVQSDAGLKPITPGSTQKHKQNKRLLVCYAIAERAGLAEQARGLANPVFI